MHDKYFNIAWILLALKCLLLFIIIRKKILKWRAPLFSAELEWTEAC
jgi:hypothetical protein